MRGVRITMQKVQQARVRSTMQKVDHRNDVVD
jgi:hypothetical protein